MVVDVLHCFEVAAPHRVLVLEQDAPDEHGQCCMPITKESKIQRLTGCDPAGGRRPGVDAGDSRFQQLFTSPDFALDPTNPQFKQTASTKVT